MAVRVLIACLVLTACAEFPDVDAAFSDSAASGDFPALVPFETLLAGPQTRLSDQSDDALRARADALRTRADALRGPVIAPATTARMTAGVTLP